MTAGYHFTQKHILGIHHLSPEDIAYILRTADSFKEISTRTIKKVPTLRGHTIVNLFFEPSTRTRLSFDIAAKRMSADTFTITASASSATKGETLIDTARNIAAMNPDIIIMRHSFSGASELLTRYIGASVINAGDGTHEHPSQGLLDMMTVQEHKGRLADLKVAIMGASVYVYGPATLIPRGLAVLGATVCSSLDEAITDADVVMTLRIQKERQSDPLLPSLREYAQKYGVSRQVLDRAKPDAIVMHPGPINRGVELTNGVAVRMALLYLVMGNS